MRSRLELQSRKTARYLLFIIYNALSAAVGVAAQRLSQLIGERDPRWRAAHFKSGSGDCDVTAALFTNKQVASSQ